MSKRDRAPEFAARILPHIPSGEEAAFMSGRELSKRAGLSTRNIRHGVAYLRVHLPDGAKALVSRSAGPSSGYKFTLVEPEINAQRIRVYTVANTSLYRLKKGVLDPFFNSLSPEEQRRHRHIQRLTDRLIEDLAEAI